jgi:hypothetical protein
MKKLMTLPILLAAAAVLALATSGCLGGPNAPQQIPASSGSSTTSAGSEASAPVAEGSSSAVSPAPKQSGVSAKSLAYAQSIGGQDVQGQTFNLIVGGTYPTEAAAQAALDKAKPLFGDMQSFFIVQRSDSFEGMAPGSWVVVEAHFKTPSDDNMNFARRGFPDASVVRARVLVTDPMPVFENLVGGD